MRLITFENYELKIAPEALLLEPLRVLYKKDKTKDKEPFLRQIGYIFFMYDPRSPVSYIIDENERDIAVRKQTGLDDKFKITSELKDAIETYKTCMINPSSILLESTLISAHKLCDFLRTVDFNQVDEKGKPAYQPSIISSTIKNILDLVPKIETLKKQVEEDINMNTRMRGSEAVSVFENGSDL